MMAFLRSFITNSARARMANRLLLRYFLRYT